MLKHKLPNFNDLPGGWNCDIKVDLKGNSNFQIELLSLENSLLLHKVLNDDDCDKLINLMSLTPKIENVSVQGRKDIPDMKIGSQRTTIWSEYISNQLWNIINKRIDNIYQFNNWSSTDWYQYGFYKKWKPYCISPMLRLMKYLNGGEHYSHYDAGYIYENTDYRSLMSMVIYLTNNDNGGSTRFINDNQQHLPVYERNHDDWIKEPDEKDILYSIKPIKGNILIFPHRLCHDVEKHNENKERYIIRGDLIFQKYD